MTWKLLINVFIASFIGFFSGMYTGATLVKEDFRKNPPTKLCPAVEGQKPVASVNNSDGQSYTYVRVLG